MSFLTVLNTSPTAVFRQSSSPVTRSLDHPEWRCLADTGGPGRVAFDAAAACFDGAWPDGLSVPAKGGYVAMSGGAAFALATLSEDHEIAEAPGNRGCAESGDPADGDLCVYRQAQGEEGELAADDDDDPDTHLIYMFAGMGHMTFEELLDELPENWAAVECGSEEETPEEPDVAAV